MSGDVFGNGMLLSRADPADRRLRPSRHLHRSRSGHGGLVGRAPAPVRRCRARAGRTTTSRSCRRAASIVSRSQKSVTLPPEAAAAIGLDKTTASPAEIMTRHPQGAGRPSVVRRHRHLCAGPAARPTRRSATAPTTRSASPRARCGAKVIGEGANLGVTQRAPHRVRPARRALQFRRHRQFRRRQLLRRRGQHQDRAGRRPCARAA